MRPSNVIDTEDKWTKGNGAVNQYGVALSVHDATACKWCVYGAIGCALGFSTSFRSQEQAAAAIIEKSIRRLTFERVLAEVIFAAGYEEELRHLLPNLSVERPYHILTVFNDASHRTFDEVRKVLLEAERIYYDEETVCVPAT